MNRTITTGIALAAACAMVAGPVSASKLSQLGKAATYPVKKAAKNTKHNVSHPVQSVTGPINQAGQTTTRTLHKVVK
jgi:hypothetical protein